MHDPDGPDAPLAVIHQRLDERPGKDRHTLLFEVLLDLLGNLGAVGNGDLLLGFQKGDLHPALGEVLGDFEPYIITPDDDRLFRRSLLYKGEDPVRVGEEVQGEDAVEVYAFDGGAHGFGSRGDDEAVVRVLELLAGRIVLNGERFVVRIYLLTRWRVRTSTSFSANSSGVRAMRSSRCSTVPESRYGSPHSL